MQVKTAQNVLNILASRTPVRYAGAWMGKVPSALDEWAVLGRLHTGDRSHYGHLSAAGGGTQHMLEPQKRQKCDS